jgi:peptidyl-tRNA hydrolase
MPQYLENKNQIQYGGKMEKLVSGNLQHTDTEGRTHQNKSGQSHFSAASFSMVSFSAYSILVIYNTLTLRVTLTKIKGGGAIFPPTVFRFYYFSIVRKMAENPVGFLPHPIV